MTTTGFLRKTDAAQASLVTTFLQRYLALQERQRQRRTAAQQSALSDHALKDIGLRRFEISSLASAVPSHRRRSHARN